LGEALAVVTSTDRLPLSLSESFEIFTGGAECSVASHLAHFGESVSMLTRVGSDPIGKRILATLVHRGVGTDHVLVIEGGRTGLYLKEPPDDTSSTMYYYRDGSAATTMTLDDVLTWNLESDAWLHTSGITAAISASCDELVERVLRRVTSGAGGTSFDVNFRPALWAGRDASARLLELARLANVVFVGLDEAQLLWDVTQSEDVAALMPGVAHVVVKDGSREAVEVVRDGLGAESVFRVEALAADVVEPIGAGDAFAAGYLRKLFRGSSSFERLGFGHLVAAKTLGTTRDFLPIDEGDTVGGIHPY
jgi:2-dehydro-3-deoxygluconokinase